MANCKNHPSASAIYKCSSCGAHLCYSCFHKYLITKGRKQIGFCSEECLQKHYDSIKEYRRKYKGEAFGFLRKSMYSFFLVILFFIIFNPITLYLEDGYSTGIKVLSYIVILQIGYGIKQLVNFVSVYFYGYNPEFMDEDRSTDNADGEAESNTKKPISQKKILRGIEELDIRNIENHEINILLEKYKKLPPYYIFAFGVPFEEILYSISQFKKHKSAINSELSTDIKLIICRIGDESTYIFAQPELHPYMFYSLLGCMDSSNSVGFVTKHNKTYMLKSEDDSEYIFGTNKNNESIEVSFIDGTITSVKKSKYPFFEAIPDFANISRIITIDLEIEDVGNFGNPDFVID